MLALLAFNLLAASASATAPPVHAELKIVVDHIVPSHGYLMIGLYPDQAAYDHENCLRCIRVAVTGDRMEIKAGDLPPGDYGIKMFHDVNGNGRLDKNMLGIPTEPYAFSNNAKAKLAPPPWAQTRFAVTADGATQTIHLNGR